MTKTATLKDLFITPDEQKMFERMQESTGMFGHIVKAMREGCSLSVAELALATGIRRKRLEAIERGLPASKEEYDHIARGVAWAIKNRRDAKAGE